MLTITRCIKNNQAIGTGNKSIGYRGLFKTPKPLLFLLPLLNLCIFPIVFLKGHERLISNKGDSAVFEIAEKAELAQGTVISNVIKAP